MIHWKHTDNFLTSNARFDSFSIFFNSATSFHHLPTYVPSPLGISVFASSTHTFSFDKLLTSFSQCPVLSLLPADYRASKPLSYVIDSQLGSWRATGYHNRSSVCDSLLASCVRLQQRQTNAAGCEGNRNDDSRRSRSRGESRIFDRDNAPRHGQVISMFIHCVWKFLQFIFFFHSIVESMIIFVNLRIEMNVSIDLWTYVWKSITKQPHRKKLCIYIDATL